MSNDEKDEEMICALTADEHVALRRGLGQIPQTMPPREVWQRIREQAEAEGLIRKPGSARRWYLGAGVAAAALLAAVMMANVEQREPGMVVPDNDLVQTTQRSDLRALMVESRELERDLRSLPEQPRVAQAGTIATISDIENRIAAIDYQLSDPEVQMSLRDREVFWRERVRMMKLLLQLRYAQAQRAAF